MIEHVMFFCVVLPKKMEASNYFLSCTSLGSHHGISVLVRAQHVMCCTHVFELSRRQKHGRWKCLGYRYKNWRQLFIKPNFSDLINSNSVRLKSDKGDTYIFSFLFLCSLFDFSMWILFFLRLAFFVLKCVLAGERVSLPRRTKGTRLHLVSTFQVFFCFEVQLFPFIPCGWLIDKIFGSFPQLMEILQLSEHGISDQALYGKMESGSNGPG